MKKCPFSGIEVCSFPGLKMPFPNKQNPFTHLDLVKDASKYLEIPNPSVQCLFLTNIGYFLPLVSKTDP
jgi:hypothetical protein